MVLQDLKEGPPAGRWDVIEEVERSTAVHSDGGAYTLAGSMKGCGGRVGESRNPPSCTLLCQVCVSHTRESMHEYKNHEN